MRRITTILLTAVMVCMTLAGCAKMQTPGEQVSLILDDLKGVELKEDIAKYIKDKKLDKADNEKYEKAIAKIQDFDYTIVKEEVNDDKSEANVTVLFKTYDFSGAYNDTVKAIENKVDKGELDRSSNIDEYVIKTFLNKVDKLSDKSKETEVVIICTPNAEGDWQPQIEDNEEVINALLGGLVNDQKLKMKS